jgi:hypothetical protein
VVFALLGRLVMGNPPLITDSTGTIASYISGHRGQIMAASIFYGIAIAMFVWFGSALATAFRRAEETSDAPAVVLAGTAFSAAIAFVAVGLFAGMTYAMTFHPGLMAGASGPYTAITILTTLAGIALAVPLVASAVSVMHTGVFPAWVAGLSILAAALSVLGALGIASTRGAFRPGSALMYLPWVVTALWVLATSALLIREHLPAVPARAPTAMGRA